MVVVWAHARSDRLILDMYLPMRPKPQPLPQPVSKLKRERFVKEWRATDIGTNLVVLDMAHGPLPLEKERRDEPKEALDPRVGQVWTGVGRVGP